MRKHKILYLILSLLLLLSGYLGYRRWHIQLVDSQEKPACLWLKTDSSPFLFLDLHRQFQSDASMKILETQFWTEKMIPIITAPSKITASYTSFSCRRSRAKLPAFMSMSIRSTITADYPSFICRKVKPSEKLKPPSGFSLINRFPILTHPIHPFSASGRCAAAKLR